MSYAQKIRELREDNDLYQKDIARILGTTQSYYAQYENGKRPLPIEHLITLCNFYNVSADYILEIKVKNKNNAKNNVNIKNLNNSGKITIK